MAHNLQKILQKRFLRVPGFAFDTRQSILKNHPNNARQAIELRLIKQQAQIHQTSFYHNIVALLFMSYLQIYGVGFNTMFLIAIVTRSCSIMVSFQLSKKILDALEQARPVGRLAQLFVLVISLEVISWWMLFWAYPPSVALNLHHAIALTTVIASLCIGGVIYASYPPAFGMFMISLPIGAAPSIIWFYPISPEGSFGAVAGILAFMLALQSIAGTLGKQKRAQLVYRHRSKAVSTRLSKANQSLNQALANAVWKAHHDSLTKMHNRRAIESRAESFVADTSAKHDIFLILIDIDKFKAVNDRWGHSVGDDVLVAIARQLQSWERDMAGNALVGRWGGEEFLALFRFPREVAIDGALDRLRKQVAAANRFRNLPRELQVSASIGCSKITHAQSIENAFRSADRALYQAKQGGRDRIQLATS